jgi:hypothetical protein
LTLGFIRSPSPSALATRGGDRNDHRRLAQARRRHSRAGGYARKLVAALIEAGLTVFVVNPRRIQAFAPPRSSSPRPTGWTRG